MTGCGTSRTLGERIREQLDALDAKTAMYARHLPSGQEVAIRADEPVNALSTIKIAIMLLAYRDAEAGILNLDQRYQIRPEDLRRGSGLLQTFAPGLRLTYRDLVTQMIITSDNTATDIVIAQLELERVNAMLAELGYVETRLQTTTGGLFRRLWELVDPANASLSDREVYELGFPTDAEAPARAFAFEGDPSEWLGRTTAREMSLLLEQIQNGELASCEGSDEMLTILRQQFYRSRLPQRIASRAAIGHKTGDWPPIAGNDVGIIYSDGGPITVSVFATQNRGDFFELEATHGRIAELLLEAWGGPTSARQIDGGSSGNSPQIGGNMSFLRAWLTGYFSPAQLIEQLRSKPAPQWGIFAQLLRGVLDSLFVYLPAFLMGRVPPTPSFLSFVPTERYYFALIWMGPFVLLAETLVGALAIHVLLRLLGRHSDVDQIINATGMSALIVGAVLIPWDWGWFALGAADQYFLGISHLVISLWATVIMAVGLRRILSVPLWLGIVLSIIAIPVQLPIAIMFMRSPF